MTRTPTRLLAAVPVALALLLTGVNAASARPAPAGSAAARSSLPGPDGAAAPGSPTAPVRHVSELGLRTRRVAELTATLAHDAAAPAALAADRVALVQAQAALADLTALVRADRLRAADAAWPAGRLRAEQVLAGSGGSADPRATAAVEFALRQLGTPYVWGGNGPDGWDCSGLTSAAYASVGVGLPRTARQQFWVGTPVPLTDLLPGDLVFFAYDPADPATIHHVVLYVGAGLFVQAPHTGDVVRAGPLDVAGAAGAVRVLPGVGLRDVSGGPVPTPTPAADDPRR